MNKSNKKLVFLFTKINKKQRTKIHPAIINNKTNRKQVKMIFYIFITLLIFGLFIINKEGKK